MRTLVVTADDFGLCAEIDEAICLLHDRGVVGRTSLVVNTPQFEASVEALRRRPGLEVAIHLNVTDGRPVLPPEEVPTLVDGGGSFRGGRHYAVLAGILAGRVRRSDVHREWQAQIAKARDAGLGTAPTAGRPTTDRDLTRARRVRAARHLPSRFAVPAHVVPRHRRQKAQCAARRVALRACLGASACRAGTSVVAPGGVRRVRFLHHLSILTGQGNHQASV